MADNGLSVAGVSTASVSLAQELWCYLGAATVTSCPLAFAWRFSHSVEAQEIYALCNSQTLTFESDASSTGSNNADGVDNNNSNSNNLNDENNAVVSILSVVLALLVIGTVLTLAGYCWKKNRSHGSTALKGPSVRKRGSVRGNYAMVPLSRATHNGLHLADSNDSMDDDDQRVINSPFTIGGVDDDDDVDFDVENDPELDAEEKSLHLQGRVLDTSNHWHRTDLMVQAIPRLQPPPVQNNVPSNGGTNTSSAPIQHSGETGSATAEMALSNGSKVPIVAQQLQPPDQQVDAESSNSSNNSSSGRLISIGSRSDSLIFMGNAVAAATAAAGGSSTGTNGQSNQAAGNMSFGSMLSAQSGESNISINDGIRPDYLLGHNIAPSTAALLNSSESFGPNDSIVLYREPSRFTNDTQASTQNHGNNDKQQNIREETDLDRLLGLQSISEVVVDDDQQETAADSDTDAGETV